MPVSLKNIFEPRCFVGGSFNQAYVYLCFVILGLALGCIVRNIGFKTAALVLSHFSLAAVLVFALDDKTLAAPKKLLLCLRLVVCVCVWTISSMTGYALSRSVLKVLKKLQRPPPAVNFATEWVCERGLIWPKAVDYKMHCPKRHVLTSCRLLPLCHVCGSVSSSGGGLSCAQGCTYNVCSECLTQLQRPPSPAAASSGGGVFPSLGVSAEFLRAFRSKWRHVIGGWTTEQVCQQLVKPLTCRSGRSVCDDLQAVGSGEVGEANLFLSHTWGNEFLDTVDAALGAAAEAGAEASCAVYIFFDVFSTSQHSALDIPSSEWMRVFQQAIEKMGRLAMVLQPWNDPLALKRAW